MCLRRPSPEAVPDPVRGVPGTADTLLRGGHAGQLENRQRLNAFLNGTASTFAYAWVM